MVYFRIIPLGLIGGSQDTTTLLADDGTALMPAGGPGSEKEKNIAIQLNYFKICPIMLFL